jgi:hypothetical protein
MSQADRSQNYYAYYQTRAFPTAPSRCRSTTKHRAMRLTRPGAPLRRDNVPGRTGAKVTLPHESARTAGPLDPTQKVIMASALDEPIRNAIEPHRGTHFNG